LGHGSTSGPERQLPSQIRAKQWETLGEARTKIQRKQKYQANQLQHLPAPPNQSVPHARMSNHEDTSRVMLGWLRGTVAQW